MRKKFFCAFLLTATFLSSASFCMKKRNLELRPPLPETTHKLSLEQDNPLCKDCMLIIFAFLSIDELMTMRLVNKFFEKCTQNILPEKLFKENLQPFFSSPPCKKWQYLKYYHIIYNLNKEHLPQTEITKQRTFLTADFTTKNKIKTMAGKLKMLRNLAGIIKKGSPYNKHPDTKSLKNAISNIKTWLCCAKTEDCIFCIGNNFCMFCMCAPFTLPLFTTFYCCIPVKTQKVLAEKYKISNCASPVPENYNVHSSLNCCRCTISAFITTILCPLACCIPCGIPCCIQCCDEMCQPAYTRNDEPPSAQLETFFTGQVTIDKKCDSRQRQKQSYWKFFSANTCPWFTGKRTKTTRQNVAACCPILAWPDFACIVSRHKCYFCCVKEIVFPALESLKNCLFSNLPKCCVKTGTTICSCIEKTKQFFLACGNEYKVDIKDCFRNCEECCTNCDELPIMQCCCRDYTKINSDENDESWMV